MAVAGAVGLEERAEAAARGAAGVVSFGLCGAVAPGWRVGDVVLAAHVAGAAEAACDADWAEHLHTRHPGLVPGRGFSSHRVVKAAPPRHKAGVTMASAETLVSTVAAKRALAATGAHAVDMESHIAARVALRHGLPLAVLRVVSDPADAALPPAFAVATRPDGGLDLPALLASLARQPGQLPAFTRAARDGARALASLRRFRRALGPGLACPYL